MAVLMTLLPNFILLLVFERIRIRTKQRLYTSFTFQHTSLIYLLCLCDYSCHIRSIDSVALCFLYFTLCVVCMRVCVSERKQNEGKLETKKGSFASTTHYVNLMKCLSSAIHGIIITRI